MDMLHFRRCNVDETLKFRNDLISKNNLFCKHINIIVKN